MVTTWKNENKIILEEVLNSRGGGGVLTLHFMIKRECFVMTITINTIIIMAL